MAAQPPARWPAEAEVLSVDLDVREGSDDEASVAIQQVIRRLGASDALFVKIDSTLRGPIAGLVRGALEASGRSLAVVAPAFPEQGRHIHDGRLVVDGRPGPRVSDVLGPLARVLVADEPLEDVARQAQAHAEWLLVGSAGLARRLAPAHTPLSLASTGHGPVLVVAGSPTAVTRAQLNRLPRSSHVVILATPPTDARDSGEAAAALAERVADWASAHRPRAVVLTGGATARAVSHRLGATSLRVHGELEPGIPVGTLQDGAWHGMRVITKAGGFGTPRTLLDVTRALGVSSAAEAHDSA